MPRITIPEAESIIDKEFPVLDHGFIRLIDYLGGDARVVAAARVSYGVGTKSIREDKSLIDYLVRHSHLSPFEQVIITFHIKLPIFVARQWVRHRTARLNELSGRYSVLSDEFYIPAESSIRKQSKTNKQDSDNTINMTKDIKNKIISRLKKDQDVVYDHYKDMLSGGIARELARINLPLSTYTQWYWQIDLRNLFNFLLLRLDSHAQLEIRMYAEIIAKIVRTIAPVSFESFEEHMLNSVTIPNSTKTQLIKFLKLLPDNKEDVVHFLDILEKTD